MYKKRAGTLGIRGQLYETKLLSLILFKAQHNDDIEAFCLGTNMDEIGVFDDICIKVKIKGRSRPLAIFIQAKHRENDDKVTTLDNKTNLGKYFESFIKIKMKFGADSKDKFFNGKYDETECVFILYTTEQSNFDNAFAGSCADILNELIGTGDFGSQPHYTNEHIEFLCKIAVKEEMRMLATRFSKFIYNKNNDMNDELIVRYHVILANEVIKVSEIQAHGRRIGKFRYDFFTTKDDHLILFRDKLYKELLKKHATKKRDKKIKEKNIQDLLSPFFSDPSEVTLGDLITENVIIYKNNRLEFAERVPEITLKEFNKINLPQAKIDLAIGRAVKDILRSFTFQVPASFGNKDLTLKNEKRRNHLQNEIIKLFDNASPSKIITINETNMDDGFLQVNGGIGGAVGNLIVHDKITKLFKFTDSFTFLEKHSKALLEELSLKFSNLQEYRLDVRVKKFPKLSFEYSDQDLVKEFFSKLVFFTNQEDENGVGKILEQEIDNLEGADAKSFGIKSEAIFLNFHEEIQKWWMQPKQAEYLTETSDLYQIAKSNIIDDPMIRVMSMMYMSEVSNVEYTFKESTISLESVDLHSRNIIVTDISRLTIIKLIQCFKIKDFPVLDLKYMSNLPTSDFKALTMELKKMPKENTIIIVCDNLEKCSSTLQRNSQEIARAVSDKSIFVITNKKFASLIEKHFQRATVINDEGNSMLDLNQESQANILKNANVIFQGQQVILGSLIDEQSVAFIKGDIFNKVILNEPIVLGESLEFPSRPFELLRYDATQLKYEIKDLYINRRVSRNKMTEPECNCKLLQTLHDINDDVVLITAKPGMGKSTLLSYLSVKTKESDTKLWLLRINLLDYVNVFSKWKQDKTVIDAVEVLQFICQAALKKKLKETNNETITLSGENGEVYLKDYPDDDWTTFELVMFLHFFKKGNLIFLFDGFDEISPIYEDEVILVLNTIRDYPRRHKIWITSRPYNKIKYILQQNFRISEPYELEPFSDLDQELYLEKFWESNFNLNELNDTQTQNLKEFIDFTLNNRKNVLTANFIRLNKPQNFLLNKVYFHFMVYLQHKMKILPMDSPLDWGYKDKLNVSIRISKHAQHMFRQDVGEKGIKDILEFVGTPLHLYLVAEYFLKGIKNDSQKNKQWDLDINTYAIYESFLESKLKKIRFQEKNKMDTDNPDIMETYETVRKEFMYMHKKFAAFTIFQRNGQAIFKDEDLEEIKRFIEKIDRGSEKTGLVYSVPNNIPQFIHMTFTEYFAVEYVSDLLKSERSNERQIAICDFIFNTMFFEGPINVLNIMDQKLKIDTEFAIALENNSNYIFNLLIAGDIQDDDIERTQMKSHLFECISKNLNNFLSIFMSTLECNIDENNVDDFIRVVANSGFLKLAVTNRYEDLLETVLKLVRNFDKSKWRRILSNPGYYCDDIIRHTQLQRFLRRHFLSFFNHSEMCRLESFMATNEEA